MILKFLEIILYIIILLIKFGFPIFVLFLLFSFVLQNNKIETWSVEARAFFVIFNLLIIYAIYSEDD